MPRFLITKVSEYLLDADDEADAWRQYDAEERPSPQMVDLSIQEVETQPPGMKPWEDK
jgi:hypothetical protein